MQNKTEQKIIETPVVTVDNQGQEKVLTIHNLINTKGKMVLNKSEAGLLYVELHKFINS